jgi:hypothetical protein
MEKAHSIGISLPGALGTYQYQSMQHGAQESTADKIIVRGGGQALR